MLAVYVVRNIHTLEHIGDQSEYYDAAQLAHEKSTLGERVTVGVWHQTVKRSELLEIWKNGEVFNVTEWLKYAGKE